MKIRPKLYKLQKQALDYASNELANSAGGGIANFNDLFTEKFAELIIKECITVLDLDDGATLRSELLEEHFGVQ